MLSLRTTEIPLENPGGYHAGAAPFAMLSFRGMTYCPFGQQEIAGRAWPSAKHRHKRREGVDNSEAKPEQVKSILHPGSRAVLIPYARNDSAV
jgi:hypothetical protein